MNDFRINGYNLIAYKGLSMIKNINKYILNSLISNFIYFHLPILSNTGFIDYDFINHNKIFFL